MVSVRPARITEGVPCAGAGNWILRSHGVDRRLAEPHHRPTASDLVTFKTWLGFIDKSVIISCIIFGLHADGLSLGLEFDGLVDSHAPLLMNGPLGHSVGECWSVCQRLSHTLCLGDDHVRLTKLVVEAPPLGLQPVHGAPRE